MHIPLPKTELHCDGAIKAELEHFILQAEPTFKPPCPGCTKHKPDGCSPLCDDAAKALSVEPDRYPVEEKVIPLVYEVMATRLMQTCWSCEGHMGMDNELWKVPQVCFYTDSQIYTKLVSIHLTRLYIAKVLNYSWHIVLIDFRQSLGQTYSIQADLSLVKDPDLVLMQRDIAVISAEMHSRLKAIANELLRDHCK